MQLNFYLAQSSNVCHVMPGFSELECALKIVHEIEKFALVGYSMRHCINPTLSALSNPVDRWL
jgi:hypothetical protein